MTDLTRKGNFSSKKGVCVASARITHDMVADTALNTLFNLPDNAVITNAIVVVEVVGQASLAVDFGFNGGDELDSAAVLTTVAALKTDLSLATGTGKDVTAKFSAAPTAGTFVFIVEFIEYDIATGALMNVTRAIA
jgi:hypothetical protein